MQKHELLRLLPKSYWASSIVLVIIIALMIVLMLFIARIGKNVHQEYQESQIIGPEIYEYDEVEEKPKMISVPKALYSKKPRGTGSPRVVVKVLVDTSGNVVEAFILQTGGDEILEEVALKTARQAKFIPARISGKLVSVWVAMPISFALQ
ncbi:MAG: energy transducer TonB [Candidatus Bathyarchaeota archaeon]|nr:energy transducer TonB [Candidatus Bathyarchaeota archaeon]UCG92409.1 MAG: energy transducer TonB [candidate division WOR-3 bacterium]